MAAFRVDTTQIIVVHPNGAEFVVRAKLLHEIIPELLKFQTAVALDSAMDIDWLGVGVSYAKASSTPRTATK
jgi:hypothetical protein